MSRPHIDWSQLWCPGPKRAFTGEEMARAGGDAPGATLLAVAGVNVAMLAFGLLQVVPAEHSARISGLLLLLIIVGWQAAGYLWRNPWRRPLMLIVVATSLAMIGMALGIRWRVSDSASRIVITSVLAGGVVALQIGLCFLVVWRASQIEGRLREHAERAKSIEMARRLAAAQIEPHFLFNTLSSAQHWVQTGDARAAPLLAALTGYLRATLPLFQRTELPAADEVLAVQRYLEVMQARMGDRLRWQIDVDAAARAARLPPGMLLTLVENAVVHGVEPQLAGGRIGLRGTVDGNRVAFSVEDDGAGPPAAMQDGIGLANIRERLNLAHGNAANLTLVERPEGGCRAQLQLPWTAP